MVSDRFGRGMDRGNAERMVGGMVAGRKMNG
jgi:hypothetical protein